MFQVNARMRSYVHLAYGFVETTDFCPLHWCCTVGMKGVCWDDPPLLSDGQCSLWKPCCEHAPEKRMLLVFLGTICCFMYSQTLNWVLKLKEMVCFSVACAWEKLYWKYFTTEVVSMPYILGSSPVIPARHTYYWDWNFWNNKVIRIWPKNRPEEVEWEPWLTWCIVSVLCAYTSWLL